MFHFYTSTWTGHYQLKNELIRWKHWFKQKLGEDTIYHLKEKKDYDRIDIEQLLFARSFLCEKKLVILEDPILKSKEEIRIEQEEDKKEQQQEQEELQKNAIFQTPQIENDTNSEELRLSSSQWVFEVLLENIPKLWDDTIVLVVSYDIDKRKSPYKKLKALADIHRIFDEVEKEDDFSKLQKLFGLYFVAWALQYLYNYCWKKYILCYHECRKLSLSCESIDIHYIKKYASGSLDNTIFHLVDAYLFADKKDFFLICTRLMDSGNVYLIYKSFLSNLRTLLYIYHLKSKKYSASEITNILDLGKRSFIVQKKIARNYEEISKLYFDLVEFDSKVVTWKMQTTNEEELKIHWRAIFLHHF